jgi:hypothetical protein
MWYVTREGRQFGPFSAGQLRKMAESGDLISSDQVWKQGMNEWVPASRIAGLFQRDATPIATPAQPKAVPIKRRSIAWRWPILIGILMAGIATVCWLVLRTSKTETRSVAEPSADVAVAAPKTAPPIRAGWTRQRPKGFDFSVIMPGSAQETRQNSNVNLVAKSAHRTFVAGRVAVPALSEEKRDAVYELIMRGSAEEANGVLISLSDFVLNGVPGKEFVIRGRSLLEPAEELRRALGGPDQRSRVLIHAKLLIIGAKQYLWMTEAPENATDSDEARYFLESFQVDRSP